MLTISEGYIYPLGWAVKYDMHSPDIHNYTEQIPGKDGEYYFGSAYGSRLITLELTSPWVSKETKEVEYHKLIETFNKDVTVLRDDLYFKGRVSPEIDIVNLPHYIFATVPLKLLEPFMWEEREITQSGIIENKGNIATYPIIEFHSVVNPAMTIGGASISYSGTCDSLVIDCEKHTVKDNGINVIHNYTGEFPSIEAGQIVSAVGNSFRLTWKNRYL